MSRTIARILFTLLTLDDLANRLFWSSPLGWHICQFEARLSWFSDHKPTWEKWLLIMGVRQ